MINGSNQFIVKLLNEHQTMLRDARKRSNPLPSQQPARTGANPPFTVTNAMFICGIDSLTLFQGDSQAKRIFREVSDNEFVSCMDKSVK